jgi:hypothetical protein
LRLKMIDFEAVIRHFGAQAVRLQLVEAGTTDKNALDAVRSQTRPDRVAVVIRWLHDYQVFQGIDGGKRTTITEAVLDWADSKAPRSDLTTLEDLVGAHTELMTACSKADGRGRDFTSLASKALWLRYPDVVPLFDSFVQRTLWIVSKIEMDIAPLDNDKSEYRKFVCVWRALYERYSSAIAAIDLQGYPYRVRIFDKILWIVGAPVYKYQ